MKRLFVTIAIAVVNASIQAQWIVYDPTSNTQQILDQIENFAQFVQMVDNQVQQISQLTDQIQQMEQYNKAFGDPSLVVNVTGASTLTADLTLTPLGQTITVVENTSDGVGALTYDANGLYHQIGVTFTTPSGNQIQRNPTNYKPYQAVNNATANYTNVTADILQRRQTLKDGMAATTQALQNATNASTVQKLTGVLIGQSAALAATDKEIDQAVDVSVMQDIENRNDAQKQAAADQEEQKAEVVEAFGNYRTNFQLNTQSPQFPTQ